MHRSRLLFSMVVIPFVCDVTLASAREAQPSWAEGRPETGTAMKMAPVPAIPIPIPIAAADSLAPNRSCAHWYSTACAGQNFL